MLKHLSLNKNLTEVNMKMPVNITMHKAVVFEDKACDCTIYA